MTESLQGLHSVLLLDQLDRWQRGDRPNVESYLAQLPELASDHKRLMDVIYQEIDLRMVVGESPTYEEYVERFPSLAKELQLQFEVHSGLDWTDLETEPNHEPSEPEFDGFRIDSELGRGTFGTVYKAWEHTLQRYVAIKLLAESDSADEVSTDEQFKEAQSIARLTHPNIVQIHSVNRSDCGVFFTQELVEGGTLASFIQSRPQDPRESATMVAWLADAIHYAHLCHVIHCDLKPANILLRPNSPSSSPEQKCKLTDFHPKISDFGLARHLDTESVVQNNHLSGTLQYMSPEQTGIEGATIGPSVDVYALGAILYELLTGHPPFSDKSKLSVFLKIRRESPSPPRGELSSIPSDLEAICMRCLEKDPGRRYTSAARLADDLRLYLGGFTPTAVPTGISGELTRWVHRKPSIAALSLALVLTGVSSFAIVTAKMLEAQRAERNEYLRAEELDAALYRNQFHLAWKAWEDANLRRVQTIMDASNPSRRSFEWHYLNSLCNGSKKSIPFEGHDISHITASPDDRWIAVSDAVDVVSLVERSTGKLLQTFGGHEVRLTPPVFSRDGKMLAAAGIDGNMAWIWLWDTETGKEKQRLGPLTGNPLSLCFSADDPAMTSVSWVSPWSHPILLPDLTVENLADRLMIEVWNISSGHRSRRTIGTKTQQTLSPKCQLSDDGRLCAWTPGTNLPPGSPHRHEIQIVSTESGEVSFTLKGHSKQVHGMIFSPDSQLLASFDEDAACIVWNVVDGKPIYKPTGHSDAILATDFSPEGKTLATTGRDQTIRLWNMETGKQTRELKGHSRLVRTLCFADSGASIISGDVANAIYDWNIHGRTEAVFEVKPAVTRMQFSPDCSRVLIADLNERLRELELGEVGKASSVSPIVGNCLDFVTRADAKELAAIGADGKLRVGSYETPVAWTVLSRIPPITGKGSSPFAYSPDAQSLACIADDSRRVLLVDLSRQKVRLEIRTESAEILAVAFRSDGWQLAAACNDRSVKIWNPKNGMLVRTLSMDSPVSGLVFRPDSDDLAVKGTQDRRIEIWNSETGLKRLTIDGHKLSVTCMTYTADGKRLITGSEDRTVKVWDSDSGEELLMIEGAGDSIRSLAISRDASRLAVCSGEDFLRSKIQVIGRP